MFSTFFIHISVHNSHDCPDLWFQINIEPVSEVSFWIRISACYWNSDNLLSLFKLILDCEMVLPQHWQKCSYFKEESLKHPTTKPHSGAFRWRLLLTSDFIFITIYQMSIKQRTQALWFKKVFTKKKYLKKIQIRSTVLVSKCHMCAPYAQWWILFTFTGEQQRRREMEKVVLTKKKAKLKGLNTDAMINFLSLCFLSLCFLRWRTTSTSDFQTHKTLHSFVLKLENREEIFNFSSNFRVIGSQAGVGRHDYTSFSDMLKNFPKILQVLCKIVPRSWHLQTCYPKAMKIYLDKEKLCLAASLAILSRFWEFSYIPSVSSN